MLGQLVNISNFAVSLLPSLRQLLNSILLWRYFQALVHYALNLPMILFLILPIFSFILPLGE